MDIKFVCSIRKYTKVYVSRIVIPQHNNEVFFFLCVFINPTVNVLKKKKKDELFDRLTSPGSENPPI